MATLVIRNVEDTVHRQLKELAAAHGRSMEEEARVILRQSLAVPPMDARQNWVDTVRALFEPLGGMELPEIPRELPRDPPDFSGPEWEFPE